MTNLPKILFIVGPTAAGKSDVALKIAQELNGEIVSCDAMQVYQEVRIASNRPSDEDTKSVPHHLVGIISVTEDFDVARFNALARKAIEDILKRGRLPVIVGGSGLYMSILLDGIFSSGGRSDALRQELKAIAQEQGIVVLYDQLKKQDPDAAAKIHPNDLRRIIRALEVFTVDKKLISKIQTQRDGLWGTYDITVYCVTREREDLYRRINERVETMFADGMVEEVRSLQNLPLSYTAEGLIGVKEIREYIDGKCLLDEAKAQIQQKTRRFAKRQLTWFRKDKRLQWIALAENETSSAAAKTIQKGLLKNE